jgi:uncharacterized protein YhhL (DUF1145 family)
MKAVVTLARSLAALLGFMAIVLTLATPPPNVGFRIVAAVLLIDQATLALLTTRLPVDVRPLMMALRIGAALVLAAGTLILVWCALPHSGPPEFAMGVVAMAMIAHGLLTFRYLASTSPGSS